MTGREPLLDFLDDMRRLRRDCPWKREQTHRSLARYLEEEASETLEAIDTGDADHLREELGDLLLQVYFHAVIAEEAGDFTLDDVARGHQRQDAPPQPPRLRRGRPVGTLGRGGERPVAGDQARRASRPARAGPRRTTGSRPGCPRCCSRPRSSSGARTPPTGLPAAGDDDADLGDRLLALVARGGRLRASTPSRPCATPYAGPSALSRRTEALKTRRVGAQRQ